MRRGLTTVCVSLVLTPFFIFSTGVAADKRVDSPLLGDTSHFKRSKQKKTLLIDRPSVKRAIDYKKMMFEPVVVAQSPHSDYQPLSDADKKTLGDLLQSMARDEFKTATTVVQAPGDGVLTVRLGIRGLKRGNYYLDARGSQAIKPDSKAPAAVFEAEAVDSMTKERVIALVSEVDQKQLSTSEREEIIPTVKDLFQAWVQELRNTFQQELNLSLIPR